MKNVLLAVFSMFSLLSWVSAQDTDTEKQEWFHSEYSESGIYGVGDHAAREFLESKGLQPQKIVVAVIDSGVEIDHDDLKNSIWVNEDEIADNGVDDDNNGYVDDVNGWDFIGGPDGDVNDDTLEMTRIVKKFKEAFENADPKINEDNISRMPETYQMYLDAKTAYELAAGDNNEERKMFQGVLDATNTLLNSYPEDQKVDKEIAEKVTDSGIKDTFMQIAESAQLSLGQLKEICESNLKPKDPNAKPNPFYDLDFDPRSIVGDNYEDPNEKYYGNNEVEGPDAFHGTHVSGIIAAERGNGIGIDGIAGGLAEIMVVRTVPNGDERDKDVANSIIYAADNGAKIMNMSFGKDFSPYKEVVWRAIEYADRKGILMFHAAGNDNKDVDVLPNFPTNFRDNKSFTNNWVTVGASTRNNEKLRANFSNYGTNRVDIFAPGAEIYSTIIDNGYRYANGTSMASPAAAGCAALLWSYFPELSSEQIREILMKTVNVNTSTQTVGENSDELSFDKLSVSGGVIDVYKAAKMAYEMYGGKSKSKKKKK